MDDSRPSRIEVPLPDAMTCTNCLAALDKRLHGMAGVTTATIDSEHRFAIIETSTPASEASIRAAVQQAFSDPTLHTGHAVLVQAKVLKDDHDGHDHDHKGHLHSHDDHDHDHAGHDHGIGEHRRMATDNQRRLMFVMAAGLLVMASELVGGLLSNSLVLLADAGHYFTDIASVALAFFAVSWSLKPANAQKTFGYQRAEVISAFIQAIALWGISIYFLVEAYFRIINPPVVEGPYVFAIGGLTLTVNIVLAITLHRGTGHNINMKAAYLHILSDVLGSAAALVAGALIYYKGIHIADPILTVFITLLILASTWKLTRQSLHILLEGTPSHIDANKVRSTLLAVDGVMDVHDLHIWTHSPGSESLTAHVVLRERPVDDRITQSIHRQIRDDLKINHITVQVEGPGSSCDTLQHGMGA